MEQTDSRTRLLNAALQTIREKGYTATRIEDICTAAGVTKGSFFHHFKSKDELAIAAVHHWESLTGGMFAAAAYHASADPLQRLLAYIDFRRELLAGELPDITCLAGMLTQELYLIRPEIVAACEHCISGHARTLEADIEAAIARYGIRGGQSAHSLALHTQAVIQGAFILAKASGGTEIAAESIAHLRRYIELLFESRQAA